MKIPVISYRTVSIAELNLEIQVSDSRFSGRFLINCEGSDSVK